jgi:hypothetical protein
MLHQLLCRKEELRASFPSSTHREVLAKLSGIKKICCPLIKNQVLTFFFLLSVGGTKQ